MVHISDFFLNTMTNIQAPIPTKMGDTSSGAAVAGAAVIIIFLTVIAAAGKYSKTKLLRRLPKGYTYPPKVNIGFIQMAKLFMTKPPYEALRDIANQVGSFTFRMPLIPIPGIPMLIVVGDSDIARSILKDPKTTRLSNDGSHANGQQGNLLLPFTPLGGPAILTANGHDWEHRRQHTNPAFSSANIKRMTAMVASLTKEWIRTTLEPSAKAGKSLNIGDELVQLSLRTVCKASFDYDISKEECDLFLKEWSIFSSEVQPIKVITNPMRRITGATARRGNVPVSITKSIIDSYNDPSKESQKDKGVTTVLDMIMANPNYKDDEERRRDILMFLIAGHDTTAYTIALTLLELSRPCNLHYQKEIRADLLLEQERQNKDEVVGALQSWSNVASLQYSIKESMRFNTVAPHGLPRIVGSDTIRQQQGSNSASLAPFFIPKGSVAIIATSLIQRNPNAFQSEDPDKFFPERWRNPTDLEKLSFMPFGYGKQNCIGQRLATATTTTVLGLVLKEYEFGLVEEGYLKHGVTLKPVGTLLKARKA